MGAAHVTRVDARRHHHKPQLKIQRNRKTTYERGRREDGGVTGLAVDYSAVGGEEEGGEDVGTRAHSAEQQVLWEVSVEHGTKVLCLLTMSLSLQGRFWGVVNICLFTSS